MIPQADSSLAIEIQSLHKRFGRTTVLDGVNLAVPAGQTFAFLGRNGAGKTTTIRTLLGLLTPDSGHVRVLGLDPAKDPLAIRSHVGYLAEDQAMFPWMRVEQLLSFMKPFYPTWSTSRAADLANRFELPMRTKVKHLSKGQSVKLGLLLALAHEPSLVILDDPALGLDPIMRKEFLRDIVTHLQGNSITVFFSSHLLYEIEPVADAIAILDRGRIVKSQPTETLRDSVKQIILSSDDYQSILPLPGTLDVKRQGDQIAVIVEDIEAIRDLLSTLSGPVQISGLNLDEIFEAYVIGHRETTATPQQPALA